MNHEPNNIMHYILKRRRRWSFLKMKLLNMFKTCNLSFQGNLSKEKSYPITSLSECFIKRTPYKTTRGFVEHKKYMCLRMLIIHKFIIRTKWEMKIKRQKSESQKDEISPAKPTDSK